MTAHGIAHPPSPPRAAFAALAALVFLLLLTRAMTRLFGLDEHQFVSPAVLLDEQGVHPYRDYPYFHMPTLPYLYAAVVKWFPMKLLAARMVNVLCGTVLILALFGAGWKMLSASPRMTRWILAGGVALTFLCSRVFTYVDGWAWNHESSVLAAFGSFLVHLAALRKGRPWWFAAAGLLIGVSISIRLSAAFAPVPLLVSILLARSPLTGRGRAWGAGAWLAGMAVGLLPAIFWWVAQPDQFVFGILGYPDLWRQYAESIHSGRMTMLAKIGNFCQSFLTDPGNAVILILFLCGVCLLLKRRHWDRSPRNDELLLLAGVLVALWMGVSAPAQVQYQYHFLLLPFIAWGALALIARDQENRPAMTRWLTWGGAAFVLAVATGLPRWYWQIIDLPRPSAWTPVAVHRTGLWVRSRVPSGQVLTIDPLVAQEGGAPVYPAFATGRFIMHVGAFESPAERHRYGMAWGPELEALLQRQPPAAMLYRVDLEQFVPVFLAYARDHAWETLDSPDGQYRLWRPPPTAVAQAGVKAADRKDLPLP